MMSEIQEEIQEKDAEDEVINRTSELRKMSENIDKATTAVINAKLSLESSIRQTQREEGVLGATVNTISKKVDSINEHIDQVMEDASTKLKVIVTLCDADWEKMQKLHNQWPGEEKRVLEDHHRWQKESWQKQSQRLTDIVRPTRRMDFHKTVLRCRFSVSIVNHNDCIGDSLLCVFQVDSVTMNSYGSSATSRTLFQVKNCPLLFNG